MLLVLAITISLSALAVYGIARTTQAIMSRLGLDLLTVLLWLGLAERRHDA